MIHLHEISDQGIPEWVKRWAIAWNHARKSVIVWDPASKMAGPFSSLYDERSATISLGWGNRMAAADLSDFDPSMVKVL